MPTQTFSFEDPKSLKPNPFNTRTHPQKQIQKLKRSIKATGFSAPVIVNKDRIVLAGHARLEAAMQLELKTIPVVKITGISPTKQRALMLADNRIAQDAGTDWNKLAVEVADLTPLLVLEDLDISITGYDAPEIESLAVNFEERSTDPEDDFIVGKRGAPVTRRGDLWISKTFRLLCGDARNVQDIARLMAGKRAHMAFLDVPYNLKVSSIVGRGKTKHREFAEASGEMSTTQFKAFLTEATELAAGASIDGAVHYICIDWRHLCELIEACETVYGQMLNLVAWVKSNAGQGSFYRSQHELIGVFRVGHGAHLNNIELGKHGRNRSNVWHFAGVNSFRAGRMDDLQAHPTVKPIAMIVEAIKDCTRRGDIILDTFSGSGSTLLAAERVGRLGFGMEIDPVYVDVAVRRWQAFTGVDVILEGANKTFDQIAGERGIDCSALAPVRQKRSGGRIVS